MEDTQKIKSNAIIQLEKISVFQNNVLILANVSLCIERGEFVYLIGPTGSGKSSLLKLIYADLPSLDGFAQVAGYDLRTIKRKQVPYLRRKLGIVFQDFQLLTDRTVYKNFEFVLKATGWKNEKTIRERIQEVLAIVEMNHSEKRMPHQLSGGEQQRVTIARALLNNPEIILADEPTGNLDPETSEALLRVFMEINQDGKTIVMATHDYPIIQKFPARKILCENGIIREIIDNKDLIDFESLLDETE